MPESQQSPALTPELIFQWLRGRTDRQFTPQVGKELLQLATKPDQRK